MSPMGRDDTLEESERVPMVHPQLCISVDHYSKNSALTSGRYKSSDKGRKIYKEAPRVSFQDVIGYVNFNYFHLY